MLYGAIEACADAGHEPALIATGPAAPNYDVLERDFGHLAGDLGCPYLCDTRLDGADRLQQLQEAGADIAISVNWATVIVPPRVTRSFTASSTPTPVTCPLPRNLGDACPNWPNRSTRSKANGEVLAMVCPAWWGRPGAASESGRMPNSSRGGLGAVTIYLDRRQGDVQPVIRLQAGRL